MGFKYNLIKMDLYLLGIEFGVFLPTFFKRYNDKQTNTPRFGCRYGQQVWRQQAD
jgi:hypothetical protein